jgi:Mg2+ and Co2+ transporter CorA
MAQTRCYQHGKLINENFPLDEVSEHLEKKDAVVWIDLTAPNRDELELLANDTPTTYSSPPTTPPSRETRPRSRSGK